MTLAGHHRPLAISPLVDDTLKARLPWATALLQELVRIPSPRGQEEQIQRRLARLFEAAGMQVAEIPIVPELLQEIGGYAPASLDYADRTNIIGIFPGADPGAGRSLAINFHADTAPPGPLELWESDPFSGELRDGKVHGLGAWDDKAGGVLALFVLGAIQDLGLKLQGNLLLHSVIEDESTGNGTLAVIANGYGADAAIVLDGAYGSHAIIGHPGYANFRVTIYGKPAPSCQSGRGVNAIEKAFIIIKHLRKLEDECNKRLPEAWRDVSRPVNLNLGRIMGGDWTGAVAAKCVLDLQMSFLEPFTLPQFKEILTGEITRAAATDEWLSRHNPVIEFMDLATEPVRLETENPYMAILDEGCRLVFGNALTRRLVTGWCDLRHFSALKPTPCCLFGPGYGGNAHCPNEFFQVADFLPHAKVLLHLIINWCGLFASDH